MTTDRQSVYAATNLDKFEQVWGGRMVAWVGNWLYMGLAVDQ